jgi:hypothetical protein
MVLLENKARMPKNHGMLPKPQKRLPQIGEVVFYVNLFGVAKLLQPEKNVMELLDTMYI